MTSYQAPGSRSVREGRSVSRFSHTVSQRRSVGQASSEGSLLLMVSGDLNVNRIRRGSVENDLKGDDGCDGGGVAEEEDS